VLNQNDLAVCQSNQVNDGLNFLDMAIPF